MDATVGLTEPSVVTVEPMMLWLVGRGVVLPKGATGEDKQCGLPRLLFLERLATTGPRPIDDVIDEVAGELDVKRPALAAFADDLLAAGQIRASDGPGSAAASPPPDTTAPPLPPGDVDRAGLLVLNLPAVVTLGRHGYELHGHDGVVRRLDAFELAAVAQFRKPTTIAEALAAHTEQAGERALAREALDALVDTLLTSRALRGFDERDLSFRGGPQSKARREAAGHAAVAAAVDRDMARLDAVEEERRARTGVARTRVFPVHCDVAQWRNPPLSLGMLFAFAKEFEGGVLQEHFDFRPDWLMDEARVDRYADEPAIYLFSHYIWSSGGNLELSARVKEKNPHSVTMHGGPNVPKYPADVEAYFAEHPHVDIACHGEGEVTTAEVLKALAGKLGNGPVDLSVLRDVPGISYRDGDRVVRTADRERLTDLDVIPSPYLTGLFDAYAEGWHSLAGAWETNTDGWSYLLPVVVLETNRGCPYGCTFCDWGSATTSRIRKFSLDRIFAEFEWCAKNYVDTIGLADANFGIFERDVEIAAKVAELKLTQGYPKQFGTNYAKNTVKHLKKIVETLNAADILSFGLLSLQSMDEDTLDTIRRSNIKLEKYEDLAREFQRAKLPLYVDLMVGLPGQTLRGFTNDLQECINREVHAKIFPTQLLVNSPMNEPAYREEHGITAKPGMLVVSAASFTREDYDRMMQLRAMYHVFEKYGILRHVARYARQEAGVREIDFIVGIADAAIVDRDRWPVLSFAVMNLPRHIVPPGSWDLLLAEVRRYLVEELHVADDAALDTVLRVQKAVLPSRGRRFPDVQQLPHDYVAWYRAALDAKHEGHLFDWEHVVPRLREHGPGELVVEDPRDVCHLELGRDPTLNPWDAWDLDSPLSRPVVLSLGEED